MTGVRLLVGTRKGAFVLTSDVNRKEWEVAGPHFAGWQVFHIKGRRLTRIGCMPRSGQIGPGR